MKRQAAHLIALCLLIGCGQDSLSGEEELLLSTTSGEEEPAAFGAKSTDAYGTPGEVDQPPLFRECDAPGFFDRLFARYDKDTSGRLNRSEETRIHHARSKRGRDHHRMMRHRWHFLHFVYDADDDGELAKSERADLLADHTERCENLHAQILEEFDEDGDGLLSEDEKDAAHEELRDRHEVHRERMREAHQPHQRDGHKRPDVPPPVMDEFDANMNGKLSSKERAEARVILRDRLSSGQPPCGETDH